MLAASVATDVSCDTFGHVFVADKDFDRVHEQAQLPMPSMFNIDFSTPMSPKNSSNFSQHMLRFYQ